MKKNKPVLLQHLHEKKLMANKNRSVQPTNKHDFVNSSLLVGNMSIKPLSRIFKIICPLTGNKVLRFKNDRNIQVDGQHGQIF